MQIEYLAEFTELCETMNYLQAAEKMYISQSNLSRHIQSMEKELGVTLFKRTKRTMEITEAGQRLLGYAKRISADWSAASMEMQKLNATAGGTRRISIGFIGAMAPYSINQILSGYQMTHRDVSLKLVMPRRGEELEMLHNGTCDMVLHSGHAYTDTEYVSVKVLADTVVAVTGNDHPLTAKETLTVSDLAPYPIAVMEQFVQPGDPFCKACMDAGVTLSYLLSDGSDLLDRAAVAGEVAIMTAKPASYFADESVTIMRIVPEIEVRADLICLRKSMEREEIRSLMEFLQSEAMQKVISA